ncbi:MAG: GNAT family N-acetyltransferase [Pseudomonadota bacterium]
MTLALTLAVPEDLDTLVALAERAYAPYVARLGGIEPYAMRPDFAGHIGAGRVQVLAEDGAILAYLIAYREEAAWLIENLAVDPARQGQGLGRGLLAAAEEAARRAGCAEIRLYTNAVMTENQALYRRLGYRETGRTQVGPMHRVHFERPLP